VNASASSIIWKQLGKTLSESCEKNIIFHLDLRPCDLYPAGVWTSVLSRLVSPWVVSGVMTTLSESVGIDIKIWKIRLIYRGYLDICLHIFYIILISPFLNPTHCCADCPLARKVWVLMHSRLVAT
jgi:hypothetical protein